MSYEYCTIIGELFYKPSTAIEPPFPDIISFMCYCVGDCQCPETNANYCSECYTLGGPCTQVPCLITASIVSQFDNVVENLPPPIVKKTFKVEVKRKRPIRNIDNGKKETAGDHFKALNRAGRLLIAKQRSQNGPPRLIPL